MAFKYVGKKFDDADPKVDQAGRKVYGAFPFEAIRRAVQGIANRVIGTTSGTASSSGYLKLAGCGTGGTGVAIANTVVVLINGQYSTCIAQDPLTLPDGSQGSNTVAKYLICTSTGTSATCIGPGNVVDKGDYASATLAAAAAKLPDLPDGYCALGYVTLNAPAASAITYRGHGTIGSQGTTSFTDLVCMPYDGS